MSLVTCHINFSTKTAALYTPRHCIVKAGYHPLLLVLNEGLLFVLFVAGAYRQCLWDPVKVSITKHSPSLRQYARSLSRQGLKCSDRSVEYVVVSEEERKEGNAIDIYYTIDHFYH